jgi:hypothetical protein
LDSSRDHHSRAYRTLQNADSKTIAAYMGIKDPTVDGKCTRCHAPVEGHEREGVTCEHCHGAAKEWLDPHHQTEFWKQHRSEFVARGFYDNRDLRQRADKCASCHVEIDHEIVAGGHPTLQFEMVAYANLMKHWADPPVRDFSTDPTLWAIGQVVGLRHAAEMIARRAGSENYQALGKVPHFKDRDCYQCHHKLLDDALRQAQGHYAMVDLALAAVLPDKRAELEAAWTRLGEGVRSSAELALQRANELAAKLPPYENQLLQSGLDQAATRKLLHLLTGSGQTLSTMRRFSSARSTSTNATRVDGVSLPWWYTTGSPEQAILAVQALCTPAFDAAKCGAAGGGIAPELGQIVKLKDYETGEFARLLAAMQKKLF